MGNKLTLIEVSKLTDLHPNTLRKYLKTGKLKGEKLEDETGRPVWVVDEDDLYGCEAPTIVNTLSPKKARQHKSYSDRIVELEGAVDDLTGEISRLEGELEEAGEKRKRLEEESGKLKDRLKASDNGVVTLGTWFYEAIKLLSEKKIRKLFEKCKIQFRYEIEDPESMEEWKITFKVPGYGDVYSEHKRKKHSDEWGKFLYYKEMNRRAEEEEDYHH